MSSKGCSRFANLLAANASHGRHDPRRGGRRPQRLNVITSRIKATKITSLLWLVGFATFFLSAILDNLTTTIVMLSLMKKLLDNHDDRLFFAAKIFAVPRPSSLRPTSHPS